MKIHCPNCKYEGKGKDVTKGGVQFFLVVGTLLIGLVFWPLLIALPIMIIKFISDGRKYACPVCKFQSPIPLHHYNKTKDSTVEVSQSPAAR